MLPLSDSGNAPLLDLFADPRLPSPTAVAVSLGRLCAAEQPRMSDVVSVLKADPTLCGRLIRLVNLARSGLARPVTSVPESVNLLGFNALSRLALGVSLIEANRRGVSHRFDFEAFWSRSLATGVAALVLARRLRRGDAEEFFTLGLLAGIGQLALACVHPDEFDNVLEVSGSDEPSAWLELERQVLLTDHQQVGATMLLRWGMPTWQVEAVRALGSPPARLEPGARPAPRNLLDTALSLSRILVARPEAAPDALVAALRSLPPVGLGEADLEPLLTETIPSWEDLSQVMDLPVEHRPELPSAWSEAAQTRFTPGAALPVLLVGTGTTATGVLVRMLAQLDCVVVAVDAEAAIPLALAHPDALLIGDWEVVGREGGIWLKTLRALAGGQTRQVIALGPSDGSPLALAALQAGADAVLDWPCHSTLLTSRITAARRLQAQRAEEREAHQDTREALGTLALTARRMEHAANTDALTGLPNRQAALERLRQAVTQARASGESLACALIDVDHFKRVNDSFGHHVGDRVLMKVASTLRDVVGGAALVTRYGGEEFLIVPIPGHGPIDRSLAERLVNAIAGLVIELEDRTLEVTISLGLAALPVEDLTAVALIDAADQALYAAKGAGRNRVNTRT